MQKIAHHLRRLQGPLVHGGVQIKSWFHGGHKPGVEAVRDWAASPLSASWMAHSERPGGHWEKSISFCQGLNTNYVGVLEQTPYLYG